MILLAELLTGPGLDGLVVVAGPTDAVPLTGVRLETRADRLAHAPAGCLLVLATPLSGYRLDVAVRDLAAAGAAGLVLTAVPPDAPVPATARELADRGGVAILHTEGDLAALILAVDRAVRGGAADALARVDAAAREMPSVAGDPERVARAASRVLGIPVELRAPEPGEAGASARGPDGDTWLSAPERPGPSGQAVRAVLALGALAAAAGPADDVPVRSRGQLLAELLAVPEAQALRLGSRGRALGLPVDGWHLVLRVEPVALAGTDRYRLLETAGPLALRLLRSAGVVAWNAARVDEALILARSQPTDPGRDGMRATLADAARLLTALRERSPDADLRCGVGAAHRGVLGLRTSAREAHTALSRSGGGLGPVAAHDAAGLDRMLLDWYSSDAAREAVRELLAPVLALGPQRAVPLLRTLQAYLDHQGSPARAAEELHLHRNAVTKRVRKVGELIGADLEDPQQRLAVQLACRAHLM
ncbi:PucR family transcriptional regulator [Embleya sp. NPDC050493]|uniref:PucR family transcriptional regulator n=1 Tax=Embleya sp. NPDC050493 TaxID=3363989 RepID=UPI0037A503D7